MKPFKPPPPIATNSLLGLCVAVQAAVTIGDAGFGQALVWNFGLIPARISAALAGKANGLGTATEQYLAQDGITPRITVDFDGTGNRTAVAVNGA